MEQTKENIKKLMFAGKAILSFRNPKTGNHLTYKFSKLHNNKDFPIFVSALVGPNNSKDYRYIGVFFSPDTFKLTDKSPDIESLIVSGFNAVWQRIQLDKLTDLEINHSGRCCRCGRLLTTPESVQRGLGPECATRN